MSYVITNRSQHTLALNLKPHFDTEGVPGWRVRREVRSRTLIVKLGLHQNVDLMAHPYNLSEKEIANQPELKTMFRKGYIQQIVDDKLVEPFAPPVTQAQVMEELQSQAEKAAVAAATADEILAKVTEQSGTTLTEVPVETSSDEVSGSETVTEESPEVVASVAPESISLTCECGFVGKSAMSIKMHQRSCKVANPV